MPERIYNMMVRLTDVEQVRMHRCRERLDRQRMLDGLRQLGTQSDFVRHCIARRCDEIEAGTA